MTHLRGYHIAHYLHLQELLLATRPAGIDLDAVDIGKKMNGRYIELSLHLPHNDPDILELSDRHRRGAWEQHLDPSDSRAHRLSSCP